MGKRIENYALIGNTRTAALVGRDGSIDWLCLPRFDSGACFAALLGDERNGRWLIEPTIELRETKRRYRGQTLVLESELRTQSGTAVLTDFMPVARQSGQVDIVRIIRGISGRVPMRMAITLRFDYGRTIPWLRRRDYGFSAIAGPNAVRLRCDLDLKGQDFETVAEFEVAEGQTVPMVLTWYPSNENDPDAIDPAAALEQTLEVWEGWSARCASQSNWRDPVMRSLLTLKALTYQPTGGIIAAPTTSLPEKLGGVRNWDYRYCWLRDSTMTLYALLISGYVEEAHAWREWLLRAIAGHPQDTQIMYALAGERDLPELELPWLAGYEASRPVRIGNAAHEQFQLDVFGEVLDSLYLGRKAGLEPNEDAWRLQAELTDFVASAWQQPDDGIWEVRGPRQHFTHSKLMAWVAVDRSIKMIERFRSSGEASKWKGLRDQIRDEICARGFDAERNSFVQHYGSRELDASLLMIPMVGFLPASDPRVAGTVKAIQEELVYDGLVMRYSSEKGIDGLPAGEGAFLACSFWLADNLALAHRGSEARAMFERLLDLRNDVGLLAEQYDPVDKRQLGNFPQAFTHVALVNTAHNLGLSDGPAKDRANC
ncbi:MAG TPA: glycoside hydrolase family 15 protein [Candidatus Binataceae bacterium]|nr:glycoside hydrolase family 15 protein [Candidatus Binataceae bacterium]